MTEYFTNFHAFLLLIKYFEVEWKAKRAIPN